MRLLHYKDLDLRRVKPAFAKVRAAIEAGDFRSADVKKLHVGGYYRAKLDYANRLLLRFARHGGETVCLALEVIESHAYDKSRFLRGAPVDESKIEDEAAVEPQRADAAEPLRWLHPQRAEFEMLDKPIVFDDEQEAVHRLPAPLVLVGSAGSGKTAVTLAKLREADGRVLYVTQSAYLARSALSLYEAHGYENDKQDAEFLSYREFVETLRVPPGREVRFDAFRGWFDRHRAAARALGDIDAHALFEEFRGVVGARPGGPLALPDYLALGTRQSLLAPAAREGAHALYARYREWLAQTQQYDLNLVAHEWQPLAQPTYDHVVIDEVQDLTAVQLALVLACLKKPGQFLLAGDSNQIVHPNFFSWSAVKALFWQGLGGEAAERQPLHVLQANYRNTEAVTGLANRLLKIKQARFGSIDRESNFLVRSTAGEPGEVNLVAASDATLKRIDAATRASVHHAVIVLRDEDKPAAKAQLRTPLVFSVHEAKGLEYPHVVLLGIVSGQRAAYADVCEGVTARDLEREELEYRRAKDKADKSLELYKFYVNALYVALTRAVQTLTIVESDTAHPLLALLGLQVGEAKAAPATAASTRDEWAQEARKLELQGKDEQARAIREAFLQAKPVPWTPWSRELIERLAPQATDPKNPSAKPRQTLFDYALWHGQHRLVQKLAKTPFQPARAMTVDGWFSHAGSLQEPPRPTEWELRALHTRRTFAAAQQRHLQPYTARNFKDLLKLCDQHGIDHLAPEGATRLMLAARAGHAALVHALLERGAGAELRDEFGHTAWLHAVSRAMQEAGFARTGLAALFDLLAPPVLDVQTDGRLVRLERHHGEYWVLTLMLAGLKTQWSACIARTRDPWRHAIGFFADQLHDVLEQLPAHLWSDKRRKRGYVNNVLARGEVHSSYRPARKLWMRTRHGYYLPNPAMSVRWGDGWRPVYEVFALEWIEAGSVAENPFDGTPSQLLWPDEAARVGVTGGREEPPAGSG